MLRHANLGIPALMPVVLACGALTPTGAWAEDQDVSAIVNAHCAEAFSAYDRASLTDRDLLSLIPPSATSETQALVAAWYLTTFSVVDHAVFTLDAAKMGPQKRSKVTDALASAVDLMTCLTPTETELSDALPSVGDRADFVAAATCFPDVGDRLVSLLRSDATGEELTMDLKAAMSDMKTNCKKKG